MIDLSHFIPSRRGIMGRVALVVLAALSVVALSRCRMADDRLTGVRLEPNRAASERGQCVRECQERFRQAVDAEEERHDEALEACGEDSECREAENELHAELRSQIQEDMKSCKRNCYNEGSGKSGG